MKKLNLILGLLLVPGICGYESVASEQHPMTEQERMDLAHEFATCQGKLSACIEQIDNVISNLEDHPEMDIKEKLRLVADVEFETQKLIRRWGDVYNLLVQFARITRTPEEREFVKQRQDLHQQIRYTLTEQQMGSRVKYFVNIWNEKDTEKLEKQGKLTDENVFTPYSPFDDHSWESTKRAAEETIDRDGPAYLGYMETALEKEVMLLDGLRGEVAI